MDRFTRKLDGAVRTELLKLFALALVFVIVVLLTACAQAVPVLARLMSGP